MMHGMHGLSAEERQDPDLRLLCINRAPGQLHCIMIPTGPPHPPPPPPPKIALALLLVQEQLPQAAVHKDPASDQKVLPLFIF